MNIPFYVAAKGMQHNHETGLVRFTSPSAFEPLEAFTTFWQGPTDRQTQNSICSSPKQYVQKNRTVVLDEQTKLPRKGEDQMPVGNIQNIRQQLLTPLVRAHLATTRTEDGLATVRNDLHRITVGAQEKMSSQLRCPAGEHSLHMIDDSLAHTSFLPCQITLPIVARAQNIADRN